MNTRARAARLPGGRLHLQDGPIDLVIIARGEAANVERAFAAAARRFSGVLDALCAELVLLRSHARIDAGPDGEIARRMWHAVLPHAADGFITPMAAVAGAVAEDILAAMRAVAPLHAAAVNNGGDIAVHLAPGESWRLGLVDRPDRPSLFARAILTAEAPVRGVATSGWRGRSFSRGIADAVTVLATGAAAADAAATVLANAVDLPNHPAIRRVPARDIQPDSDLDDRLVTSDVGALTSREVAVALDRGLAAFRDLHRRGLAVAAAFHLQGTTSSSGEFALLACPERADA